MDILFVTPAKARNVKYVAKNKAGLIFNQVLAHLPLITKPKLKHILMHFIFD